MKLVKQIEKERSYYLHMLREADKQDEKELAERFMGVIAALDWVRGSRNNTDDVIDFTYIWWVRSHWNK